ncbi:MAG: hypothetical protein Q7K16_04510 [Candidatus Azambacteria bacterium]|nr:hypothetical protein [Candidatus Azambacteria bacterium]
MNFKNQKIIEVDGWRAYDFPIECKEADYDEARVEIVNQVRNTPGLVALFEYGWIPYPGMSDMDFWAVFCDDAEKMGLPSHPALSEKTKYLMSHQIMLISEKHYRKMLYFDPWTTYIWPNGQRLLYKKEGIERDLNFENIKFTKDERDILSLAHVEENLSSINSAIPFYAKKELPIRHILEVIKTCVYIIEEVNLITDKKINSTFSEDLKDLRSNWFKIDERQAVRRLIKLFYDGLLISFETAFSLNDWIRRHSRLECIKDLGIKKTNVFNCSSLDKISKNIYLNTFGIRRVFTDFVNTPLQALELSINSYKKIKIRLGRYSRIIDFFVIFQPLDVAAIHMGIVSENGALSNNLKKDTFSNLAEAPVFKPKIFQEKIKMINEIIEIYNRKQVKGADGKGGIFWSNLFGYSFGREKLRRKFVVFWLRRKFWRAIKMATKTLC